MKTFDLKKIVVLCYDFPPLSSIGGQRPYSWFKNFKSFGLYPIVITNNWIKADHINNEVLKDEEGEIHYVKSPKYTIEKLFSNRKKKVWIIFRKIISFLNAFLKFNYSKIDKTNNLNDYATLFLNKNNVEYLLVSGEPFILFKYGHQLSEKYNIPWFADYRDDWIDNHGRRNKGFLDKIIRFFEKYYEKKYLSNSSGIISVSDFLVDEISKRVKPISSIKIENGIDLAYIENSRIILDKKLFNIVYTGTFYESHYMEIFYNGFKKFYENNRNENVRIYFVGIEKTKCSPYYKAIEMKKEYKNIIKIIDQVDIQTATNYQISSTILLSFIPGDPSKGIIGAKSYSYAATGKPILLIPEIPNKNSPFFPGRNIQNIAVDENEVFIYLSNKFIEFEKNQEIKTDISKEEIIKLSRKFKANELAQWILKKKLSNQ